MGVGALAVSEPWSAPGLTESRVHPGLRGIPLISWAGYGPLAVGSFGEEGAVGPWKASYALPQPCRLSPAPARGYHQGCLWSFAAFHPPLLTGLINPSLRIGLRITAQHRWAAGCDRERSGLESVDLDLNPVSSPCPQALTWNKLFSDPAFSHLSGGNSGYTSKQYSTHTGHVVSAGG